MAAEVVRPWRFIPGQGVLETYFHQAGPATVDWIWLPMHKNREGSGGLPALKIPTLAIIASIPPGKGKRTLYIPCISQTELTPRSAINMLRAIRMLRNSPTLGFRR